MRFLLFILLVTFSYTAFSMGPSFDCKKASSPLEKKICGSETLSQLDLDIAKSFKAQMDLLSPEEAKSRKAEQIQWNSKREKNCSTLEEKCLLDLMRARLVSLQSNPVAERSNTKIDAKLNWREDCYRGPEQILCISKCDDKGCKFEFAGVQNAPCEDGGSFLFSIKDKTSASVTKILDKKKCKTDFGLDDGGKTIIVETDCACNKSIDGEEVFDLSGEYVLKN